MLSQWPTDARVRDLAAVTDAIRGGSKSGGVVLTGSAGVGKTTLARFVVKEFRGSTRWLAGTETAKGIPLGAFADLVEVADTREPHSILRQVRSHLLGGEPNVVVGVDDAHMLDQLSASLVHQLAVERAAKFVVTVRTGHEVPDAIRALWTEGLLTRIELQPFNRTEVTELVEKVLGGPLETVSADRLYQVSQGNPLFVRHLVEGAAEAGNLRLVAGVWQLRGRTVINPQLSTLVESRLAELPENGLGVVELLAFGGVLDANIITALRDYAGIRAAASAGLAKEVIVAQRQTVELSHPIYGEVVRARTGTLKARRIRGELVGAMSSPRPVKVSDRIRLMALALDSDVQPEVGALIDSGADALTLGNLELGERFARRAVALGGGSRAALVLAQGLSWQGRGQESDAVLAAIDSDSLSELEAVLLATTRAANTFWMLRDPPRAAQIIDAVRARLTVQLGADAVEMWHASFTDRLADSVRAADAVLASPYAAPVAQGWAAFISATAQAQMGQFGRVKGLVERGLVDASRSKSGMLRFNLGLAEVPTLLMSGAVQDAEVAALRYVGYAVGQQPARAKAGVLLGQVHAHRGRLAAARGEFAQAAAALQNVGYSWEFLAAAGLCQTNAALGRVEDAAAALDRAEGLVGGNIEVFGPERDLCRAWVAAAQGQLTAAITHARDAAATAAQSGRHTAEAGALFASVRFGDRTVAARLAELAAELGVDTVRLQAEHAAALAADGGAELIAVASKWELQGALLFAAEAAAQSAVAFERAKDRRWQISSSGMAARLAAECDGAKTLALVTEANPLPLTAREREIASLVAIGLSNKDIADRLAVSVRTVEGHIYRACIKVDVADRDGLAQVVRLESHRS